MQIRFNVHPRIHTIQYEADISINIQFQESLVFAMYTDTNLNIYLTKETINITYGYP